VVQEATPTQPAGRVLSFVDFVKDKMRPLLELARAGASSGLVKVESPVEASGTGRQRQ
jgi:hypothetical protein